MADRESMDGADRGGTDGRGADRGEADGHLHRVAVAAAPGPDRHAALVAAVRARSPLACRDDVDREVARVLWQVEGFGPIQPLLDDDAVTELMVNGDGAVWVERHGQLIRSDISMAAGEVLHVIERVVAPLGLRVDRSSPLVDARLPDGSRVHAVVPPLAVDGPVLTVRRFGALPVPLSAFAPAPVCALLASAVAARANILVAGGTGSGKTTLLNALAASISRHERVVTVEDAAELRLPGDHVVRLEARPANADGVGAVGVRELVRNALRMRPDRIVVGEVRGPEALDMLQAMNTGHEGSLSTCHANSPVDALRRLETMILMGDVALPLPAVRDQLVSSLDLVVQVARRPDGSRRIVHVVELAPDLVDGRPHTRLLADTERLLATPVRPPRRAGAPC